MGIRIIHGNGDLIGAAFEGVGEGAKNYQEGQKAQADIARAEQVATSLAEQLRMDQETHAQGVQLFNEQMIQKEAHQDYLRSKKDLEPDQFDLQDTYLEQFRSAGALSDEDYLLERNINAENRKAFYVEQTAMGKRAAIKQMLAHNPEAAAGSPVLAEIASGTIDLETMSPLEIHETLQTVEDEINAFEDQQMDLLAAGAAGNSLRQFMANPNTSYEVAQAMPEFIRALNLKDNPQALSRWLAAMNGEAPGSSMYDGGPVEEIQRQYLQWRQQNNAKNQAGADAANMGLGGGGQAGPAPGEQFGQGVAAPVGDPESFGRVPAPAPTGDEFSDQLAAKTYETRVTEGERLLEDGPTTEEEWSDTVRYAHDKLMEIDAQAKANGGLVPMAWLPKEERRDGYRKLREYGRTLAGKPNARALLAAKAQELGLLMDPEADKDFLMTIVAEPDSAFRARLSALAESVDPRPRLKEVVNKKAYNRDNTGKLDDVRSSLRAEFPDSPYLSEKGQVDERAIIKAQEERQRKRNKRLFGGN